MKRGLKPCSVLSGELFKVFTAYQESVRDLIRYQTLPVLKNILERFQESGMSPIPEELTKKIQELAQTDLGHTLSEAMQP